MFREVPKVAMESLCCGITNSLMWVSLYLCKKSGVIERSSFSNRCFIPVAAVDKGDKQADVSDAFLLCSSENKLVLEHE